MKALRIYSLSLFLACTHILNAASLNLFDGQEPNNQEGEKFISIPEYNFKITRPFNTWKNRNPKSLNDDTCLLFSKSLLANTTFMIIAEQLGADFNWSIEDYRDVVVENLENVGTNLIINRDKERSIDGVKGRERQFSSFRTTHQLLHLVRQSQWFFLPAAFHLSGQKPHSKPARLEAPQQLLPHSGQGSQGRYR